MSYVYIVSETAAQTRAHPLYTCGFYDPSGLWHPESDHSGPDGMRSAADRCAFLNAERPCIGAAELARILLESRAAPGMPSDWRAGCDSACDRIARAVAEALRPNLSGRSLEAWYSTATAGGRL